MKLKRSRFNSKDTTHIEVTNNQGTNQSKGTPLLFFIPTLLALKQKHPSIA